MWEEVDAVQVRTTWHSVYWPADGSLSDFAAYDYADAHFCHAWSVEGDYAYFENVDEATQFALLFGG